MIWNVNGDVVSIGEYRFAINSRWFVEVSNENKLKSGLMTPLKMLIEDVACGLVVDLNGKRQIAKSQRASSGLPLLAACFIGKKKNCCIFSKVGVDKYWAISINANGFVTGSPDNDKCSSLDELKKFIYQEMIMSDDQSSYEIVNVGDRVELGAVELSSLLKEETLGEDFLKLIVLDDVTAERQIGFRRTQIGLGAGCVGAALLGLGYYFFYVTPPIVNDIANGVYSDGFTRQYNSLKEQEEKLFYTNNRPKTKADIMNDSLSEFNEFLLTRNKSNQKLVSSIVSAHHVLPERLDGWGFTSLSMNNGTNEVVYTRLGKFPVSLSYANLDADITKLLEFRGYSISPVRLLSDANVRVYQIKSNDDSASALSPAYTKYLAQKRESIEGRQKLIDVIKDEQAKLDRVKSAVEDSEQSVQLLSTFDAHDSKVVDLILESISGKIKSAKPLTVAIKKDLERLREYKSMQPPANSDYLLSDSEVSVAFVNQLQSIPNITWSHPKKTVTFPSALTAKSNKIGIKQFVGVTGYEFSVTVDSKSSMFSGVEKLLGDKRLFLVGSSVTGDEKGLPKVTLQFEYFVKS